MLTKLRDELMDSLSNVSIDEISFTEHEVYEELCKIDINEACGPDEIPSRLLKEGAAWLMEPISKLFTMSMQTGELPKEWKRANITPVFKKGDKRIPSNYRPISLSSIFVNMLERLIHNRMSECLNTNN